MVACRPTRETEHCLFVKYQLKDANDEDEENGAMDKRAWNQFQGSWGKRAPLAQLLAGYKRNWSNLRGAWGKREIPLSVAGKMKGQ